MLIQEYKLDGSTKQYQAIDDAIRIVQFIRNKCLRLWMDTWAGFQATRRFCISKRGHFLNDFDKEQHSVVSEAQGSGTI